MRKPHTNSQDQITFAKELMEMNGIDLLDGRHIAKSVALHRTAEMKRRRKPLYSVDDYIENGGKITIIPPRMSGGEWCQDIKKREFPKVNNEIL